METLSKSRIATFAACPRKYEFHYIRNRVPIASARALKVGVAWHRAMEVYWKEGREPAIHWLISQAEGLEDPDVCRLTALLKFYNPPLDSYEIVSIEEEFQGPIRIAGRPRPLRGFRYGGRRDGVVRSRETGLLWLLENKTTSDQIAGWGEFWRRLNLDAQSSWYLLYGTFEGVLYNVVRKSMLRPPKGWETTSGEERERVLDSFQKRIEAEIAENPGEFYQCREIRKTPDDLAEAAADLAKYAKDIHACRKEGFFQRNTDSCRGMYGMCQYIDVCSGAARLEDDSLFTNRPPDEQRT